MEGDRPAGHGRCHLHAAAPRGADPAPRSLAAGHLRRCLVGRASDLDGWTLVSAGRLRPALPGAEAVAGGDGPGLPGPHGGLGPSRPSGGHRTPTPGRPGVLPHRRG